jgi:hypothetical protein
MKGLITDEIIDALVPQGSYAEIGEILIDSFAPIVDRMTFPMPEDPDLDGEVSKILASLRAA